MRRHTATTALDTATTAGQAPVPPPPSSPRTSPALIRAGGTAAQVVAGTYVVGFLVMAAYLVPRGFDRARGGPRGLARLPPGPPCRAGRLVPGSLPPRWSRDGLVSLGVGQRLAAAPALGRFSTALGLIWSGLLVASGSIALVGQHAAVTLYAQNPDLALNTWVSTSVVQDALGGGIEVAGALWAAAVGLAALRTRALSAGLGGLALGLAAVGMATVIPIASEAATSIFGLGLIVWFTWLGLALRRR